MQGYYAKKKGLGMNIDLIRGIFYGVVFTVFIGFVRDQMKKARGTIEKRNKPLDTFPDAAQPHLTPAKIVRESIWARIKWFLWLLLLIFVCGIFAIFLQGELTIG